MKGAISCLFYGARTLACPASSPTDLMPPNISRRQAHCSAPLGWATSHAHNPAQIPGNLMRLATDTEHPDRIFFAGRLLAVSPFVVWEFLGGCRAECIEFRTSAWESHIG